jgi:CRISPR-associated protein Cmr2
MGNNLKHTLHFTFGPVQEFVAQSRKTRDLWAGSYLLSYLAGKAMAAIPDWKGNIIFPEIRDDRLIELIQTPTKAAFDNPATRVGSLPNRFTARIPEGVTGQVCAAAIQDAWRSIADAVRRKVDPDGRTIKDDIWNRQVAGVWEFQWVIGDQDHLLDQRKNMRLNLSPPEHGEKCTICGLREELSGASAPLRIEVINQWWQANIHTHTVADLREGERLCAVCLTKRMFPVIAHETLGWNLSRYFPSTAFMAAVDWLDYLFNQAQTEPSLVKTINSFVDAVTSNVDDYATEYQTMIPSLDKAAEDAKIDKRITYFDGNIFHAFAVADDALKFKTDASPQYIKTALQQLQSELKGVDSSKSEATPFYAILLMDGDGMGKLIAGRLADERKVISSALCDFTRQVLEIVSARNGWLIYAGGDDVFALLPVDQALGCAARCRAAYQNAFCRIAPFVPKAEATISAAIEYAHIKTPLGPLVRDAHRLLDSVAKDEIGRDAVACRVWKRGGPILTWSQPWEAVITPDGNIVAEVRKAFQNNSDDPDKFSSKFFYKLKDLFDFTNCGNLFDESNIRDLLTVEYLSTREHNWGDLAQPEITRKASRRIEKIMALCRVKRRKVVQDGQGKTMTRIEAEDRYLPDGALLVRFLSQKEV